VAAKVADVYVYYLRIFLARLKMTPRIEPYIGYGNSEVLRLNARVIMGSKRRKPNRLIRGFRTLFTSPVPNAKVSIRIDGGDEVYKFIADRGGYINALINVHLQPGWHKVEYALCGKFCAKQPVCASVLVLEEDGVGIISDVDDTVMVSMIPHALRAAWTMLFRNPKMRKTVPGMKEFYDFLGTHYSKRRQKLDTLYVTSSPWNVEPSIRRFLGFNDYDDAPVIARDWGPTENALFLWGATSKYDAIEQLIRDFPCKKWILVGDDGQKDPTIYRYIADKHTASIEAVVIRQLTPQEQILAHYFSTPYSTPSGLIVPVYYGPDGYNLIEQFKRNAPTQVSQLP
jgi:phosphatidate phosphatase APP1